MMCIYVYIRMMYERKHMGNHSFNDHGKNSKDHYKTETGVKYICI